MEQPREEARGAPGAPGAPRRPQKPSIGSTPSSNAKYDANGHQTKPLELQKQSRGGSSHPIAASGGQATSRSASGFDSPGGASPVSAASHASGAFLNSNGAQARPPEANCQPHNGVPLNSSHGQQHTPAVSVPQKASAASPSVTQSDMQNGVAPVSAAPDSHSSRTAADTHGSALADQSRPSAAKYSTQTASSADALKSLPGLVTSAPAANGKAGSDSSRQHGSTGDAHGSATSQSPIGQLSASASKPVMKMKRTGKNFPLSSPRPSSPLRTSASLQQRKAPSPNRTGSVTPGSSNLAKTSESLQSRGSGLSTAVNGSSIGEKTKSNPSVRLSTNCRANASDLQYKNADTRDSKWKIDAS